MSLRRWFEPAAQRPRRPTISIDLGPAVPAWLLRGLAGLAVVPLIAVMDNVALPILAAVVAAAVPHPSTVAALLVGAAVYVLTVEPAWAVTASFVLVLHVLWVLVRLVSPLPLNGVVELRLVAAVLRPFVVLQLTAQLLAALSLVALAGMPTLPWIVVPAVTAIAAAAIAATRWAARSTS